MGERLQKAVRTAQVYVPRTSEAKYRVQRAVRQLRRAPFEPDFGLLRHLPPLAGCQALDVGANRGQSIDAIRLFAPTVPIVSFEPNRDLADALGRRYRHDPHLTVNPFGLGDDDASQPLYVPRYRRYSFDGLASFDRAEAEGWLEDRVYGFDRQQLELEVLTCELRRLDDLELRPYFMKVDVQGCEIAVVRGGLKTIERCTPVLLLEAPTAELVGLLHEREYQPYAYAGGCLRSNELGRPNTFFLTPEWRDRVGVPVV